jgi:signal transduction histidine kinase
MKYCFSFLVVFFLFFSLIANSQGVTNSKLDSVFKLINDSIENREFSIAQNLIKKTKSNSELNNQVDHLKIDFLQSKIFIKNGQDEKAINILLNGFSKVEEQKKSDLYIKYSQEIGRLFGRAKNYDKSFTYFNLALESALSRKDSLEISEANFNIGSAYQMNKKMDSARYFYQKVITSFPKMAADKSVLGTTYSNYIGIAVAENDFKLAEVYGNKSLEIHYQMNDTLKMAGLLTNLGGISMYNNDLTKSNFYSYQALELLEKRNDLKSREIKAITLDNISQAYYLLGDHKKAYDLLFESATINNKIITDNLQSKVTEIEAKYNLAKESELTKIEENKRQRVEFLLLISGIGFFGLLGFLWFFYRDNKFKRLNLKLAHNQENIEAERKIDKIQNDVQIKILNATLDAKETERKYIAGILHDSVSSLLSSANMHLYAVKVKLDKDSPEEINKAEIIISEAADKIRNLSHKLISSVLLKFGLKAAIEDSCEKYSNSQLSFICNFNNINRYDQSFEIKVYNIIEELINNILKHSNAKKASINIEELNSNLEIKIVDDGKGFAKDEIFQKDGLGLSQIDARIKNMNGVFTINSSKEEGTQIYISVPFN